MWWKVGLAVYVVLLVPGILFLQGASLLEQRMRRSETDLVGFTAHSDSESRIPRQLFLPLSAPHAAKLSREQPGLIAATAARIAGLLSQLL